MFRQLIWGDDDKSREKKDKIKQTWKIPIAYPNKSSKISKHQLNYAKENKITIDYKLMQLIIGVRKESQKQEPA